MRRFVSLLAVLTSVAAMTLAGADVPHPDPNFATTIIPNGCTSEHGNAFEAAQYANEGWAQNAQGDYERYASSGCVRMHFVFGPLKVQPGQNDVLIQPVSIEKPAYDGYITRFRPDLVDATGAVPPIEQVHLHHGTWIQLTSYAGDQPPFKVGDTELFDPRVYGDGPFFASGEEKTIGDFPRGYGFPVKGTDHWDLLYMVHNATAQPKAVYITYDVDYVAATAVNHPGQAAIQAIYPYWLDVRPSSYPVYNNNRPSALAPGQTVDDMGGACAWPSQKCAVLNSWGVTETGQGRAGNGVGTRSTLPKAGSNLGRIENFQGATIVALGGHLHPGGLTDEIDVSRGDARTHVFTSDAEYWSHNTAARNNNVVSADRNEGTSWDFSMTGQALPYWGLHLNPGDSIWINSTYDNTVQASYEDMGIVVAFIAPDKPDGTRTAPGIDPFVDRYVVDNTAIEAGQSATPSTGNTACRGDAAAGIPAGGLGHFDAAGNFIPQFASDGSKVLCIHGGVTHGWMPEAQNFGGKDDNVAAAAWTTGAATTQISVAGFLYLPGDLSQVAQTGLPAVKIGETLQFVNYDAAANVYHTITACKYPCNGTLGVDHPIANGESSTGGKLDFDSAELGYSPTFGPAKGQIGGSPGPSTDSIVYNLPVTAANGFAPGRYTYFCRVHPFMRGGFEVTN